MATQQEGWGSEDELLEGVSSFTPGVDEEVDEDALLGSDTEQGINLDNYNDDDWFEVEVVSEEEDDLGNNEDPSAYDNTEQTHETGNEVHEQQAHDTQDTPAVEMTENIQIHINNEGEQDAHIKEETELNEEVEEHTVQSNVVSDDEESDDEDKEESRGRFKSERKQIVSLTSRPKDVKIPETLELSKEDQAQLTSHAANSNTNYQQKMRNNQRNMFNQRHNQRGRGNMNKNMFRPTNNRPVQPMAIGGRLGGMPFQPIFRPGVARMTNNVQRIGTLNPIPFNTNNLLMNPQQPPFQSITRINTYQPQPQQPQSLMQPLRHSMSESQITPIIHNYDRGSSHQANARPIHVNPHFKGTIDMANASRQPIKRSIEEEFGFNTDPSPMSQRQDPLSMFNEVYNQRASFNSHHQSPPHTMFQQGLQQQRTIDSQFNQPRSLMGSNQFQPQIENIQQTPQQPQQPQTLLGNRPQTLLGNRPPLLQQPPQHRRPNVQQFHQEPRGQPIQTVTGVSSLRQQHLEVGDSNIHQQKNNTANRIVSRGQNIPTLGSCVTSNFKRQNTQQQVHQPPKKASVQQRLGPQRAQTQQQPQNRNQSQQPQIRPQKTQQLQQQKFQQFAQQQHQKAPAHPLIGRKLTKEEMDEQRKKLARAKRFSNPPIPGASGPIKTAVKRLSSGSTESSTPPKNMKLTRNIVVKQESIENVDDIYKDENLYKQKELEMKRRREEILRLKEQHRQNRAGNQGPNSNQQQQSQPQQQQQWQQQQQRPNQPKNWTPQLQPKSQQQKQNFTHGNQQNQLFIPGNQQKGFMRNQTIPQGNRQMAVKKVMMQGNNRRSPRQQGKGQKPTKMVTMTKAELMQMPGFSGVLKQGQMQGQSPDRLVTMSSPAAANSRKIIYEKSPSATGQRSNNNNRTVIASSNELVSRKVVIEGLSTTTNRGKLINMARSVGPFTNVQVDTSQKKGTILFKNADHARVFAEKHNRHMIDLSSIRVNVIPE